MTPAGEILAAEIRRGGPVPFRRFMEVALYHPQCGYYRRPRSPFGRAGDFYTAEQLQPVFGILMAQQIRAIYREMGGPRDFTVVELGAGRQEMAQTFAEWRYVPVEFGSRPPARFRGVVFCNEFFDALPVESVTYREGTFRQRLVRLNGDRFVWETGSEVNEEINGYMRRYFPAPVEGQVYEVNLPALSWIDWISDALEQGHVLTFDYGYTRREAARFPAGTLMAYRRHTARTEVLEDPGEQDITAHVNFTAIQEHGERRGLRARRFETLAQTLLDAGEADQFEAALGDGNLQRRMQLKALLFGMGETFRTLWQERNNSERKG
jgi:SAM-dependent MidA family methyltransferase